MTYFRGVDGIAQSDGIAESGVRVVILAEECPGPCRGSRIPEKVDKARKTAISSLLSPSRKVAIPSLSGHSRDPSLRCIMVTFGTTLDRDMTWALQFSKVSHNRGLL